MSWGSSLKKIVMSRWIRLYIEWVHALGVSVEIELKVDWQVLKSLNCQILHLIGGWDWHDVSTSLTPCLPQCYFRVNPTDRLSARFENIKLVYTPVNSFFKLNLNTNTERVNSLIVPYIAPWTVQWMVQFPTQWCNAHCVMHSMMVYCLQYRVLPAVINNIALLLMTAWLSHAVTSPQTCQHRSQEITL